MIIIKTKKGSVFVSNSAIKKVVLLREENAAKIFEWKKEDIIKDVENVIYINEQTGTEWKDEGSEVDRLKEKVNRILDKLAFAREGFITSRDMARAAYLRLFPEIECIAEGEEKNFDATDLVKTFKEVKEIFDNGFEKIRKEYDDRKARDEGEGGGSAAQEA